MGYSSSYPGLFRHDKDRPHEYYKCMGWLVCPSLYGMPLGPPIGDTKCKGSGFYKLWSDSRIASSIVY